VTRETIAIDVELELGPGTDSRAPGGKVTRELCGHWEHEGPCRWPHNSRIDRDVKPTRLRTIVVISDIDRDDVLRRIEGALRRDDRWETARLEVRPVTDDERALAQRLA
jgi:hypothetical protein